MKVKKVRGHAERSAGQAAVLAEGAYAAALGSLGSGRSMLSPPFLREADAVLLLAFVGGFIDSSGYLKLQAFSILIFTDM